MKYQATRNGQYIGEPKSDRPAAQQVVCDDMDFTKKAYEEGWITKEQLKACHWHIVKVRGQSHYQRRSRPGAAWPRWPKTEGATPSPSRTGA